MSQQFVEDGTKYVCSEVRVKPLCNGSFLIELSLYDVDASHAFSAWNVIEMGGEEALAQVRKWLEIEYPTRKAVV